jgi:HSP90 family molecular chaperone
MSEYELRESFAKVGKRFRDLPEFLEVTKEWGHRADAPFRPISQFGIGVLSYFMIAAEVVLWTIRSDDRESSRGDALEVRIANASGIFRIGRPLGKVLPNTGTTVRLYLRKEFADLDLAGALRQVIAAPLVRTRLKPLKSAELVPLAPCLFSGTPRPRRVWPGLRTAGPRGRRAR